MDKKRRREILTAEGRALDVLVERFAFNRLACGCDKTHLIEHRDVLQCALCGYLPAPLWSESQRACHYLKTRIMADWPHFRKTRFLDFLGEAIAHRLESGKVEPRLWVLLALPVDVARAAALACAES